MSVLCTTYPRARTRSTGKLWIRSLRLLLSTRASISSGLVELCCSIDGVLVRQVLVGRAREWWQGLWAYGARRQVWFRFSEAIWVLETSGDVVEFNLVMGCFRFSGMMFRCFFMGTRMMKVLSRCWLWSSNCIWKKHNVTKPEKPAGSCTVRVLTGSCFWHVKWQDPPQKHTKKQTSLARYTLKRLYRNFSITSPKNRQPNLW